jgi:predicted amino acid dehydrogenase
VSARSRLTRVLEVRSRAERALLAHRGNTPPPPADSSSTSALELQRIAAYSEQHRRTTRELGARLGQAQVELEGAEAELASAQRALALASADKLVIERDRLRFEGQRLAARDAREQAELDARVKKAPNSARN